MGLFLAAQLTLLAAPVDEHIDPNSKERVGCLLRPVGNEDLTQAHGGEVPAHARMTTLLLVLIMLQDEGGDDQHGDAEVAFIVLMETSLQTRIAVVTAVSPRG